MKLKLLFSALLISALGSSQSTINTFYGANNTSFLLLTSASALDHSPTGANQTWNFSQMLSLGTSVHTYVSPTTQELATYPGTTTNIVSTSTQGTTINTGYLYTKNLSGTVSITGLNTSGLTANFSTNNATIGTFPMNFGYTYNDSNVAGSYVYGTYSGTFTGTLTTSVDAYGTLTLNDAGNGGYSGTVTRMKNVLNISLNYGFLQNVGTATQTSYTYFDPTVSTSDFVFRSVTTTAFVSLVGINQTDTTIEKYPTTTPLSVEHQSLASSLWIKNPLKNTLEINSSVSVDNANISITDVLGKIIFNTNNQTINGTLEIPVSLSKGVYLVTIKNDNDIITKKIVEE
jgi:hypothetical protein